MKTPLQEILTQLRKSAQSEREKGTYFEELVITYLNNEATYKDLYSQVWTYADWASEQELDRRDAGIDLVAKTSGTDEYHAIQCKFYAQEHRIQKSDIDSFFTASGKKPFTHRVIVATTNKWSEHAEDALQGQQPPVSKIDLHDLENSRIDWSQYKPLQTPKLKPQKTPLDHQKLAIKNVVRGLENADRGKLIMACGTGKTYTSLKIAEEMAGRGKRVLFLVPSLSLLSQALTEWTQESVTPLHSFAVCSDSEVGKKRNKEADTVVTFAHELRYPATTEAAHLAREMQSRHDAHHMSVVFSTYHSIDVIHKAQKSHKLAPFDIIICDEAHRTTGATFAGEDESNFVKVHDADFIKAANRLYMTATPRIYAEGAKSKAQQEDVSLCSMDDDSLYGKQLHVITFSEAVARDLLVDYKVIVLTVDEEHISARLQSMLADENNEIKLDDAAKIIGCWKALSKQTVDGNLYGDVDPMKRAVAFCQVIEYQENARTHKVSSKNIANMFQKVVEEYQKIDPLPNPMVCETAHVDGGMNATEKEGKLQWLKEETPENICRILSNVRCLSEGVDVPALDSVLFLTPRNSQVDVVQSVGRVMRKAPGKKKGYVILPVVIPAGTSPEEALGDNKTYRVVWQVLQALRSHDDRFNAHINKLEFNGADRQKIEIVAVTDKVQRKRKSGQGDLAKDSGRGGYAIGQGAAKPPKPEDTTQKLPFDVGEIEMAIYAKIVEKCGNRHHWEEWANDIAKIANTHITRIKTIVGNPKNQKEIEAFTGFADELRDDLNEAITNEEVVEMLAQHMITRPVFEALFSDYSFANKNPVSLAMDKVLEILHEHHLEKEADTLNRFYENVKMRADGIQNAEGKQKIILELYDKFFRNAFPKMTERLGIVYTPVEVVDFIIHSVNDVLQSEFGQTLGSDNVHILDPFTGTGTFITRLMQSGLLSQAELKQKYKSQIHANEIVLLAYYIATINIESVYHDMLGGDYTPFEGACLTDTFQLYEKEDEIADLLADNSDRRNRQKKLDIRVIIGNPPYSAGQESANDNNQNVKYPLLDARIGETYAKHSTATNKNALYDSYIRAISWASDRIGDSGVLGFVTNAGWVDGNATDGLRKCLAEEFSSIYVFHLRGNQRTSGELSRKEGGKIFGSGSRAPIAISLLVKNPKAKKQGQIYFHDIGDYLKREEKLEKIQKFQSIHGLTQLKKWTPIEPDKHHDWIDQRDDRFYDFIVLGDKKDKNEKVIFENYSRGIATSRDTWAYQFSRKSLIENMSKMITFYNQEVQRFQDACDGKSENQWPKINNFISHDPKMISWNRSLINDARRKMLHYYRQESLYSSVYRPFTKNHIYFNKSFNDMIYQMPQIFPHGDAKNYVIYTSGSGNSGKEFSALIVDIIPDLNMQHSGGQGFPLYLYESNEEAAKRAKKESEQAGDLFAPSVPTGDVAAQGGEPETQSGGYTRRDAITDEGLAHFHDHYAGSGNPKEAQKITKEDLFYYIYGLLHSETYRAKYADNLSKELPRIPAVKKLEDFWAFSRAGRTLGELHIDYEKQEMHPVERVLNLPAGQKLKEEHYYVEKMRYGKNAASAKEADKSTLVYNDFITLKNIPLEAYDYVVNGKAALDWIVERYCVKTDKDSGIVNDANLWGIETENNPRYPLELFCRVITVSLETMKIVRGLPELEI